LVALPRAARARREGVGGVWQDGEQLSAEEDPLKREIEEMRHAAREARIERRKPRKKSFELFPEELVQKE
jgi:hypothetical protein